MFCIHTSRRHASSFFMADIALVFFRFEHFKWPNGAQYLSSFAKVNSMFQTF